MFIATNTYLIFTEPAFWGYLLTKQAEKKSLCSYIWSVSVQVDWNAVFLIFTDADFEFDICYTSVLKRAIRTLWLVLDGIDQMWVPVHRTWRLNERHYGGLTGLNKAETAAKHGEAQVKIWRRSFDIPPPPMDPDHNYYTAISKVRYDIYSKYAQPISFVGLCGKKFFSTYWPSWPSPHRHDVTKKKCEYSRSLQSDTKPTMSTSMREIMRIQNSQLE